MWQRMVSAVLVVLLMTSGVALAEADDAASRGSGRSTKPIWTVVGIGAGFGVGVWAGLTAFDDSINSDRKVWTSAIVAAAAGGVLGYLVDRHRAKTGAAPARQPSLALTPAQREKLVSASPRLGDGQLKHWLNSGMPGAGVSSIE